MKFSFLLSGLLLIAMAVGAQTGNPVNPFLDHNATAFPFNAITEQMITSGTQEVINRSNQKINAITAVAPADQNIKNTLLLLDDLSYELIEVIFKLQLIQATSTRSDLRKAAIDEGNKLSLYATKIYLNEPLYRSVLAFSKQQGSTLNPSQQKFLTETIEEFEKQGMKLPAEKRGELDVVNEKIIRFGSDFERNIAEWRDSLFFNGDDLAGVAEQYKNSWKKAGGKYLVYVTGPNYVTILESAEKSETRRKMYMHYNNRAYPANINALDSLLFYRNQLATRLGFRSYAAFALVDKMAQKPETARSFQDDLQKKLQPYVTGEMKAMRELKKKLNQESADTVYAWDVSYLTRRLKDSRYSFNSDEVKEYFEMGNTLTGMFKVYEQLFNISIRRISNLPVWEDKVQTYEIYNEGKKAGTFYLDLYPRQNKYTHFACFPIAQYRKTDTGEVLPVASLVCNFPEGSSGQPSLLPHRDVITLFHEFGHLVHAMLARPELSAQGPFAVKRDFVEAPSQFLENWCWEYPSLKILAKNYKTGAELPRALFDKMKKAQNVNVAGFYMRQLYLGYIDLEYEDNFAKVQKDGLVSIAKQWYPIMQVPYPAGSHFICSFGHLYGYAAGYYGYLWSRVYAQDMFSLFEKNGVMDNKTGIRYKNMVLEKGSSVPEQEMLRTFLGREPDSRAFLRSLGLPY